MTMPSGNYSHHQIIGHLQDGEVFNWGYWVSHTAPLTQAQQNAIATGVAGLITSTTFATAKSLIPALAGYDTVRTYSYTTGSPQAYGAAVAQLAAFVGTGTSYHPLQSALVMSLRTPFPGPSNRGRYYLPANAVTLDNRGQIGSGSLASIVAEQKTFLNGVNALTDVDAIGILSKVGTGDFTPVTALIADSRLDVQRRRANKESVEARVEVTIP